MSISKLVDNRTYKKKEVEEINNAAEEVKPEETVATENSTEEEK